MAERQPRGIKLRDETDKPQGTYKIDVHCENCDWKGEVDIPKGTPVPKGDYLGELARCDNCGCKVLKRAVDEPQMRELLERMRRASEDGTLYPSLPTPIIPDSSPTTQPGPYTLPWRWHNTGDPPPQYPQVWCNTNTLGAEIDDLRRQGYTDSGAATVAALRSQHRGTKKMV